MTFKNPHIRGSDTGAPIRAVVAKSLPAVRPLFAFAEETLWPADLMLLLFHCSSDCALVSHALRATFIFLVRSSHPAAASTSWISLTASRHCDYYSYLQVSPSSPLHLPLAPPLAPRLDLISIPLKWTIEQDQALGKPPTGMDGRMEG